MSIQFIFDCLARILYIFFYHGTRETFTTILRHTETLQLLCHHTVSYCIVGTRVALIWDFADIPITDISTLNQTDY